jgi:hypothetical protein
MGTIVVAAMYEPIISFVELSLGDLLETTKV